MKLCSSRKKKILVVPVSYREKIRVGRSEIINLKNFFSCFFPIISVRTDVFFASSLQPSGENRVARSIALKK